MSPRYTAREDRQWLAFLALLLALLAGSAGCIIGINLQRTHDRDTLALACAKLGGDPRMCEIAAAEMLK